MSIKKFGGFVNEMQSTMKPIENSTNVPTHDHKNIADVLGDKHHINTTPREVQEFEEEVRPSIDFKPETDDFYAKSFKEYQRTKFKETPPFKDDKISNSDFGAQAYHDDVKMEIDNMNENGVAGAVASNGSGMGAVVTAQPSATPGQTLGGNNVGDSYGDGGTVGSGDIAVGSNKNIIKRPEKSRRKKKAKAQVKDIVKNMGKNIKNTFKESDYKKAGDKDAHLMSFSTFSKKK